MKVRQTESLLTKKDNSNKSYYELARGFVNKYPLMFNNEKDNDFWINEIALLIKKGKKE